MSIIWIDLETTGLEPQNDTVLEIAAIVTDDKLRELARFQVVTDMANSRTLAMLHPAVQEMHTSNGLWRQSELSGVSLATADQALEAFLDPHKGAQLAGSSVHFDRAFMKEHLPRAEKKLHYRHLDVSTLNETARRFWPRIHDNRPGTGNAPIHRALPDIEMSIRTLNYYLQALGTEIGIGDYASESK